MCVCRPRARDWLRARIKTMPSRACGRSWQTSSAPKRWAYSELIAEPQAFKFFGSLEFDLREYDLLRALGDAGLQRVMRGECHVEFGTRESSEVTSKAQAFVPIMVADQTIAILAILRLLPQKAAFDRSDMELFKLLSDEAASPLFGRTGCAKAGNEGPGMSA